MSKVTECGNCNWYDPLDSRKGSGFCTVNPPTVILDRDNIGRSYRPMVDADSHCCREWESMDTPIALEASKAAQSVSATAPKPVGNVPVPPAPKSAAKKSK